MKSKMRFGSWRKVTGSGFSEWMTSGNLIASRMKKTGEVVADEVPVAVLGVELHREAARVARDLGGVAAADDGREADGERRLLAGLLEQLGAGVLGRRLVADLAGGLELAVADEAAGVHDPLGDALAVEVGDLLEEVVVLQRGRTAAADGALGLVVGDRVALPGGQDASARRRPGRSRPSGAWGTPWPWLSPLDGLSAASALAPHPFGRLLLIWPKYRIGKGGSISPEPDDRALQLEGAPTDLAAHGFLSARASRSTFSTRPL